jgi:hypothetical protein
LATKQECLVVIRRASSRFSVPIVLIATGLVYGLLYVFLIPPWQHNDEPGHFEYVWLIANRSTWPHAGDYDPAMRRAMLVSMSEHGFERYLKVGIDPTAAVPNIGLSQVGDMPIYYWLAALPLRLMHNSDITLQLYASRLVSLILYLATLMIAWGVMRELTPDKHALRLLTPMTLALLPGFTNTMTSVNNDVGAVAAFSLFIFSGVVLIRRGPSFPGIMFLAGTAALCYWTKNNIWLCFPLIPVVLLFAFLRGKLRFLAWGLLFLSILIGILSVFSWGDAAFWYRRTAQSVPTRAVNSSAPVGEHAFRLDLAHDKNNALILQPLPPTTVLALRNVPVILGAWAWASEPMGAEMQFSCDCGGLQQTFRNDIQVGPTPKFFTYTMTLPVNARHVSIVTTVQPGQEDLKGDLFFDGLVLVKGTAQPQDLPHFTSESGDSGTWDGKPFVNLLRNSSAESGGPGLRPWASNLIAKVNPYFSPYDVPVSFFDWDGAGWYYRTTGVVILRTFWAKFGWGEVPLLGSRPYRWLGGFSLLGVAGAAWLIWRKRSALPWKELFFLGLALIGIWIQAALRGLSSVIGWTFIPVARYIFPVIIPTILILCAGWLQILSAFGKWFHLAPKVQYGLYFMLFTGLDIFAIVSIIHFYY